MAPAVLASGSVPLFLGQCGDVYMRKHTNNSVSDNKFSPSFNLSPYPNPNSNPSPNSNYWVNQTRGNGNLSSGGGHVTFNLASYNRNQIKELKKRLISELERVRFLRDRVESGDFDVPRDFPLSEVSTGRDAARTIDLAVEKNGPGLKRKNPFGTEISDVKRQAALDPEAEKVLASMMRRCSQILGKIMKHKFSWVFNQPVDVVGLGLHDYHHVVKKPMDLGTVKSNLVKGLYRSPLDFSSDVRLTFNNALIYNPKGHDVNYMAEQLLRTFDEMFDPAYKKFEAEQQKVAKSIVESSFSHQQLQSRIWNQNQVAEDVKRGPEPISIAKKLESVKPPVPVVEPETVPPAFPSMPAFFAPVEAPPKSGDSIMVKKGKLPKPKAKDVDKRQMTVEEKTKLALNLQELPHEKLDQLIRILRKRNSHLAPEGDEIELDIEAIDNETLWELDRFVTNYKKMASKIKRQGFIQNLILTPPRNTATMNEISSGENGKKGDAIEDDVDIGENIPMANYPSVEIEKDTTAASAASSGSSSSGSSSSSSSGSSSSDSGSRRSSSGSDSDANSVQSPFTGTKEAP